jgi:hypothetical protein
VPVRKGSIGKIHKKEVQASEGLPELMAQRRKKQLGRSLSVDIAPQELEGQVIEVASDDVAVESPTSDVAPTQTQRFNDIHCN